MKRLLASVFLFFITLSSASESDDHSENIYTAPSISHQIITGIAYGDLEFYFAQYIVLPVVVIIFPAGKQPCSCVANQPVLRRICGSMITSAMEEVFFRWTLQPALSSYIYESLSTSDKSPSEKEVIAEYLSIYFTSIFFGLAHIFNPRCSWRQVGSATISGFLLSFAYKYYGPVAAVVSHITHNLLVIFHSGY